MNGIELTKYLLEYRCYLTSLEKASASIEKYCCAVRQFCFWLGSQELEHQALLCYHTLLRQRLAASTCNGKFYALHTFFLWLGRPELQVRAIRCQRRFLTDFGLDSGSYRALLCMALEHGRKSDYWIMRTLASAGLRVGELKAITPEVLHAGRTDILHKGKCRQILLPAPLCCELLDYCAANQIESGPVFRVEGSAGALHPSTIWRRLKVCAALAGMDPVKVYPHAFRAFFARSYLQTNQNISELADLMGRSSLETTRIYLRPNQGELRAKLERMAL